MTSIESYVDAIHNPPKDILDVMDAIDREEQLKRIEYFEKLDFEWATNVMKNRS